MIGAAKAKGGLAASPTEMGAAVGRKSITLAVVLHNLESEGCGYIKPDIRPGEHERIPRRGK